MRHDRAKGTNTGLSVRELRAVGAYVAAARGPGSLPARHVGCANCAADVSVRRQSLPGEKAGLCGRCDPAGKASDRVYRAVESAGLFLGFIAALPEPPPRGSLAVPGPYWVQRQSQEPPRSPLCVRPPPLYGLCCIFAEPLPISLLIGVGLQGSGCPGPVWAQNASKPTGQSVGSRWEHRSPLIDARSWRLSDGHHFSLIKAF